MPDLALFGNVPVNYAMLTAMLDRYLSPKDKVAAMEKQQLIIRIKKGLFVVSPEISKCEISRELIANHLYGPSYISLESALSYHSLIPERVYAVRSVTEKRAKRFTTPFGTFDYRSVPENYFSIGIQQEQSESKSIFLIASPEKSLCDIVLLSSGLRLQSVKAMKTYLEENLRIDLSEKSTWNTDIIRHCIDAGKKKTELTQLLKILKQYE